LDVDRSQCGLHAVDLQTGRVVGSLIWPQGNQIFAIEAIPADLTTGFPFTLTAARGAARRQQQLFFLGHTGTRAA
jgi:hypothetical protein